MLLVRLFTLSFLLCFWNSAACQTDQLDSLLLLLESAEGKDRVDVLNRLTKGIMYTTPGKAMEYAETSLTLSDELPYPEGKVMALINQGVMTVNRFEIDSAITILDRAIRISQEISFNNGLAYAHLSVATAFVRKSMYDTALALSAKGVEYAQAAGLADVEVSNLINMGAIRQYQGETRSAESYYKQALTVSQNQKGVALVRQGQIYVNLGVVSATDGNYGIAINHYEEGLKIFESLQMKNQMAHVLMNKGYCHAALNQEVQANNCYDVSEQYWTELGVSRSVAFVRKNRGELMVSLGRLNEGITYFLSALKALGDVDNQLKSQIHKLLSEVYERNDQPNEALDNFKKYILLRDSLEDLSNDERIAQITAKFDNEQITKENELMRQEAEIASLEKERTVIILVSGLLIVTLILVWLIANRKMLQSRLAITELDKKLMEQEMTLRDNEFVLEREKLNEKIEVLLLENQKLSERYASEDESAADLLIRADLLRGVKEALMDARDWASFQLYFDQVYPEFFPNIKARFTLDFTQYEQRLMAMIKLGMSNKEIANALSISRNSVVRAKARLRDKMEFKQSTELEDTLRNL